MRSPLPTDDLTQPYVAIVCFTDAHVPTFALSSFGIQDGDMTDLLVGGAVVPILTNVEGVNITEVMPASIGNGLVRREATFTIKNDGPFVCTPFAKEMYSAGASANTFYFGIWVTDYSRTLEDIFQVGAFFGYYRIDMGIDWDESRLTTQLRLLELPMNMFGRLNTQLEAAENILNGSEWQRLIEAPAYLGARGQVQAVGRVDAGISGYESYSKAVLGVVSGVVQSSALSGTSIVLGKSPTLATIVGTTVKLKFANGCLVSGAITDLGGGDYGINATGMVLNTAWDSVAVKNTGTLTPGTPLTAAVNLNEVVLDTAPLTRIPSPMMYLKSPGVLEFYNAGVQTSASALYLKLTGIKDEATKTLLCEDFKNPANLAWARTGVNVNFESTQQSSNFPTDDAHLNYANWKAAQTYTLHFSNKTFVLADIQVSGMGWELIVTPHVNNAVVLTNVYYVRMIGNTTIKEDATGQLAIYYNKGDALVTVPSADITSVAYANNDLSVPNMCKVTLKRRPSDTNEAYDNNFLFVDTWPPMYGAEIIAYIVAQGGVHSLKLGSTLTTDLRQGNTMSLAVTSETWTELLDSVMFESGMLLYADRGLYQIRPSFTRSETFTFNDAGSTYQFTKGQIALDFGDVIDGTYKLSMGRSLTNIDANGREFVRAHLTYRFPYSTHGGQKLRELRSTKAAKDNDRVISYQFKHIIDTLTCRAAALQISRLGHSANIGETTRTYTFGLPFKYAFMQAQDVVTLINFRHVSAVASPLAAYVEGGPNAVYTADSGNVYAKYTQTIPYMCVPGLGIVSQIAYNFSGDGVPITVTVKQVQPNIASNLRDVADSIKVNTEVENAAVAALSPATAVAVGEDGLMRCPDGDNEFTTITPALGTFSAPTLNDACCNSSSSDADIYNDPQITIGCIDGGLNPSTNWPSAPRCYVDFYVEQDDQEVDNTDTIIARVYANRSDNSVCPIFTAIHWAHTVGVNSNCVSVKLPGDCATLPPAASGPSLVATVNISPCAFNFPVGMTTKVIYVIFKTNLCPIFTYTTMDDTDNNPDTKPVPVVHTPYYWKYDVVEVPITLRPVSDIIVS